MKKTYLSPKNDLVFKLIFANQQNSDLLIDFLLNVLELPKREFDYIEFADTHLLPETLDGKLGILDIKLYTKSRNVIDIEIQVHGVPEMKERILFYLSRMITEQAHIGKGYITIKKTISIVITNYNLIIDSDSYHNQYRLYDRKTKSEFSNVMEVVTLVAYG